MSCDVLEMRCLDYNQSIEPHVSQENNLACLKTRKNYSFVLFYEECAMSFLKLKAKKYCSVMEGIHNWKLREKVKRVVS